MESCPGGGSRMVGSCPVGIVLVGSGPSGDLSWWGFVPSGELFWWGLA